MGSRLTPYASRLTDPIPGPIYNSRLDERNGARALVRKCGFLVVEAGLCLRREPMGHAILDFGLPILDLIGNLKSKIENR